MLKKFLILTLFLLVMPVLGQEALLSFETEYPQIYDIAYSPDGSLLVTSSFEIGEDIDATLSSRLQLHDSSTGETLFALATDEHQPVSFAFSPNGTVLVTGSQTGEIALWDLETLEILQRFPAHDSVPQVLFNADGTKMVTGDNVGIIVWDVATFEAELVLSPQDIDEPQLVALLVSPDNSLVTGVYAPDLLIFWDIAAGDEILRQNTGYEFEPYAAMFVPDETRSDVLLAYDDNIEIRDLLENSVTGMYDTTATAFVMQYSPDNSLLAIGDIEDNVTLWDVATQELLIPVVEDAGIIHDLAFAPDGSVLAVAHGDGMMTIFSLQ